MEGSSSLASAPYRTQPGERALVPECILNYIDCLHDGHSHPIPQWIFAEELFSRNSVTELLPIRFLSSTQSLLLAVEREGTGVEDDTMAVDVAIARLKEGLRSMGCQTLFAWLSTIERGSVWRPAWEVLRHLRFRVSQVEALLNQQSTPPPSTHIPNSYDPPRLRCAYYFSTLAKGCKFREMPHYAMNASQSKKTDSVYSECEKRVPRSSNESYLFFILCPAHGHCFGTGPLFTLIN